MNIGNSIKVLRKKEGFNQTELAEKCGISQTALSQIEIGIKKPSKKTLEKLCEVFKVPELFLYIMAVEEKDVPENKKEAYEIWYPTIQELALKIFSPSNMNN